MPFKPFLTLVDKAWSLPKSVAPGRCFAWIGILGINTLTYFGDEKKFCSIDCNEKQQNILKTKTLVYFCNEKEFCNIECLEKNVIC